MDFFKREEQGRRNYAITYIKMCLKFSNQNSIGVIIDIVVESNREYRIDPGMQISLI